MALICDFFDKNSSFDKIRHKSRLVGADNQACRRTCPDRWSQIGTQGCPEAYLWCGLYALSRNTLRRACAVRGACMAPDVQVLRKAG